MVNITRYKPANDVLDEMLRGFFLRPMRVDDQPDVQIKLDVTENDQEYSVSAEIPGVKKDDIHVSIEGNQISISAEVSKLKEDKAGEVVLRSERSYGKAIRTFTLSQDVDEESSQAKYNDGVLELILPKKMTSKPKKLNIM